MILTLLVATTNAGKLRDFAFAADDKVNISPLPGLGSIAVPAENEETFEGNARLKALYYSRFAPGKIVVADDSGLEVDALGGAPGVRSARYAYDEGYISDPNVPTDERNNQCLVAALNEAPEIGRRARYRCVLVAARDGEVIAVGKGALEGVVLSEPQGTGGFGYDPYFAPANLGQSMAELEPEARLRLSHRGRALQDLLSNLQNSAVHSTR